MIYYPVKIEANGKEHGEQNGSMVQDVALGFISLGCCYGA